MVSYTPMIQQYLSIKADYNDAFLFFRLGDFYEMFFEDAEIASRILEITLTSRDGGNDNKVPMCGVPYHSAESYIVKLIEKGYKVAICEQVEDPKIAKGVVKREVVRVVTPGTIMEGKIIEESCNNYIASISYIGNSFAIAFSDISTGEFYATELNNNVEGVINELNHYNPSEIVIDKELHEEIKKEIMQLNTTFSFINGISDLGDINNSDNLLDKQFKKININLISHAMKIAIVNLLSYLYDTQKQSINHFNELNIYETNQYMILDNFSKRNLELIQTSREQIKKGSLLSLLDETRTAMGSRLLKRWLEKPLINKNEIEKRINVVEELTIDTILAEDLRESLKNVYDIERLISKISYNNATPRDLYNLKKSINAIPLIYKQIINSENRALNELIMEMDLCEDIASIIEATLQDEPPLSPKGGDLIKRGVDEQLDLYYHSKKDGQLWLQQLERKERGITGIKSLKVGFNKVFGYYIEVTKSNLSQVPNDRYIRKQTLANAERYITEELKDKEAIILEADEKIEELEYNIFFKLREKVAKHNSRLQDLAKKISKLDVLLSFAKISINNNYVKPSLNEDGIIEIEECRHPVIETIHKDKPFIPNNVYLNRKSNQVLIITGPNMAGKSTYMRQIALTIILAQIGCFVPATKANLEIVDRIFTRIGAGDDLTSGQSTFMVEMLETKQAITQATANSLILLDEIGRGTSTFDGMAIAQAVIQYIHEYVKSMTLFSTHYHELTSLSDNYERINNVHVNVIEKNGEVIFLHKIEKGKADKSYGIHVAELAGMPKEVIESAKKILKELESQNIITNPVKKEEAQLELFQNVNADEEYLIRNKKALKLLKKIENLDLLNMTPMEGFQILYDVQKQLRK